MRKILFIFVAVFLFIVKTVYSQKTNSEIIKYEKNYTVSAYNILTEEVSIIIRINNRAGEDLTEISIPYTDNTPVTNLNARLQTPSGDIIRKLKKKEITDKSDISDGSLYEDNYVKTFTLKHNTYPYDIVYGYKKTYKNFFIITTWTPVINSNIPTKNAVLTLTKPVNYKIITYENNISKPKSKLTGNFIKYTWESQYTEPVKYQTFSPPINETIPSVKIVPENFYYGVPGRQKNWTEFGNWIFNLNKGLDYLPESEKYNIENIIKNLQTKKEKTDALYHYLQKNTRYINVSIDIGGFKPHPASYVVKNKYGDCKALTNYMKSILLYAGIKSYYSLINSGDNIIHIKKDFSTSQFNHAILMVPIEKDTIWLECTSKNSPVGYLGTFTQGRYALVVDENKSKLIKTPELNINDTEEKTIAFFHPEINETCSAEIQLKIKGKKYEYLRGFSNSLNNDQKNRYIHEFIPFKNYELLKWDTEKSKKTDASACLNFNLKLKNYLKTYDDFKYINSVPVGIPTFEKPKKRIYPVKINYPINNIDSLIYDKIEGYMFKQPKDTSINTKYGRYKFNAEVLKDKLIIRKQFILFSGEYPLTEYKLFYSFINSVKNIEHKNPIVYIKNN